MGNNFAIPAKKSGSQGHRGRLADLGRNIRLNRSRGRTVWMLGMLVFNEGGNFVESAFYVARTARVHIQELLQLGEP